MIHSRDEHNKDTLNKTQYKVLKRVIRKEKDAQVFAVEKTLEQNKQQAYGHLVRNSKARRKVQAQRVTDILFKDN